MCINQLAFRALTLIFLVAPCLVAQQSFRYAIQAQPLPDASVKSERLMTYDPGTPKKSVLLGIAYSLILPGLGDIYAGKGEIGQYYLGADAALWMAYGGIQSYGRWVKNDARTFAIERARANFSGKPQQFEVDLGNFTNIDDYNQAKLRNRQYDLLYDLSSTYAWEWNSEDDRLRFKNERIRGDELIRNSQFALGALVINRVIAAISAARSVSQYNRDSQHQGAWRLKASATGGLFAADGVVLTISKDF